MFQAYRRKVPLVGLGSLFNRFCCKGVAPSASLRITGDIREVNITDQSRKREAAHADATYLPKRSVPGGNHEIVPTTFLFASSATKSCPSSSAAPIKPVFIMRMSSGSFPVSAFRIGSVENQRKSLKHGTDASLVPASENAFPRMSMAADTFSGSEPTETQSCSISICIRRGSE